MHDCASVLGLFTNEAELRDYIADNLGELEPGLRLLGKEYPISNEAGTGGRIDILAQDRLGHTICIEVKRSDRSARDTLNELSKYVTLLVKQDRLQKESIRCIVVSTNWKELLLPLSYFAAHAGVDVRAMNAYTERGRVLFEKKLLTPLQFLPQLSPEISILQFESAAERTAHVEHSRQRAASLPFARLALVLLDPTERAFGHHLTFQTIVFIWRISALNHSDVETVIGNSIGWLFPYGYPGWEAECDVADWITEDGNPPGILPTSAEARRGTPEKVDRLLSLYRFNSIVRLGAWSAVELINDDASLLRQIRATSALSGSGQLSRHAFVAVVSPNISASWNVETESFLSFIAFEPRWLEAARKFLDELGKSDVVVELRASRRKNVFYTIYQATSYPEARLSSVQITVRQHDQIISILIGQYVWDGVTYPQNAASNMVKVYGSTTLAVASLFSASDERLTINALPIHGFVPAILMYQEEQWQLIEGPELLLELGEFVSKNPIYCNEISAVMNAFGPIPADPTR